MNSLMFINPLKPGMLTAYKQFIAEITGPQKEAYTDLLKRYHHKTAEIWYYQYNGRDYVVVYHEIEEGIQNPLAGWSTSSHPFDKWFAQQLNKLHDFEGVVPPEVLLRFSVE